MALGLLWLALQMVIRGTGRAEWQAKSERGWEEFSHLLEEEVRRANHLVTTEPGGRRLHDPRFSAIWIGEQGTSLKIRVFVPDQEVVDPKSMDVNSLKQDRITFALREGRLVYLRRGDIEGEETRVLISDVGQVQFSPATAYEDRGPLGGLLKIRVILSRKGASSQLNRELTVASEIPVLDQESPPEGIEFIPAVDP